jgi:hypothetical protein
LARSSDGSVRVPTSPVVSVTARVAGQVGCGLQQRDVTIVEVSKAWRVPRWDSCGWGGGEGVDVVAAMARERMYIAIEPVEVAAARMEG